MDAAVSTKRRRMVPSGPIRVTATLISSVRLLTAFRQADHYDSGGMRARPGGDTSCDCRRRDRARLNPTARAIDLANHGTEGRPDNSVTSSPRRRTANRKKTPIPYGLESRSHVRGQHADLPLTCGGLWSVYRRCCRAAGPRLGCGGGTAQSSCRPGPAFAGSPR